MTDDNPTWSRPWVAIQRNRSSGSGTNAHALRELMRQLKQRGLTPRLFSQRANFDAAVTDPSRRAHLMGIVAAGGDGTVLDMVNRHADLPICVFPMGTENLLAKFLRIPRCGRRAAEIIAQGRRTRFDLGMCHGKRFLIMVSCGIDATIVRDVQRRRGAGHIRHWSYVAPIVRALWNYSPSLIRVTDLDSADSQDGELVIVANINSYALGMNLVPTAQPNDGMLDARIFRIRSRWELLRTVFWILLGRQSKLTNATHITGQRFRVDSSAATAVQIDGDAAGETPIEIGIAPLAAEFFTP